MCLVDTKQFRYAEHDIPIFKVVYKKKYSPFQRTLLNIINNPSEGIEHRIESGFFFIEGFYYACLNEEDAREVILECNAIYDDDDSNLSDYSIITGYIPEGTRYAQDKLGNICAKRMILNL